jgi:hypothetical protein
VNNINLTVDFRSYSGYSQNGYVKTEDLHQDIQSQRNTQNKNGPRNNNSQYENKTTSGGKNHFSNHCSNTPNHYRLDGIENDQENLLGSQTNHKNCSESEKITSNNIPTSQNIPTFRTSFEKDCQQFQAQEKNPNKYTPLKLVKLPDYLMGAQKALHGAVNGHENSQIDPPVESTEKIASPKTAGGKSEKTINQNDEYRNNTSLYDQENLSTQYPINYSQCDGNDTMDIVYHGENTPKNSQNAPHNEFQNQGEWTQEHGGGPKLSSLHICTDDLDKTDDLDGMYGNQNIKRPKFNNNGQLDKFVRLNQCQSHHDNDSLSTQLNPLDTFSSLDTLSSPLNSPFGDHNPQEDCNAISQPDPNVECLTTPTNKLTNLSAHYPSQVDLDHHLYQTNPSQSKTEGYNEEHGKVIGNKILFSSIGSLHSRFNQGSHFQNFSPSNRHNTYQPFPSHGIDYLAFLHSTLHYNPPAFNSKSIEDQGVPFITHFNPQNEHCTETHKNLQTQSPKIPKTLPFHHHGPYDYYGGPIQILGAELPPGVDIYLDEVNYQRDNQEVNIDSPNYLHSHPNHLNNTSKTSNTRAVIPSHLTYHTLSLSPYQLALFYTGTRYDDSGNSGVNNMGFAKDSTKKFPIFINLCLYFKIMKEISSMLSLDSLHLNQNSILSELNNSNLVGKSHKTPGFLNSEAILTHFFKTCLPALEELQKNPPDSIKTTNQSVFVFKMARIHCAFCGPAVTKPLMGLKPFEIVDSRFREEKNEGEVNNQVNHNGEVDQNSKTSSNPSNPQDEGFSQISPYISQNHTQADNYLQNPLYSNVHLLSTQILQSQTHQALSRSEKAAPTNFSVKFDPPSSQTLRNNPIIIPSLPPTKPALQFSRSYSFNIEPESELRIINKENGLTWLNDDGRKVSSYTSRQLFHFSLLRHINTNYSLTSYLMGLDPYSFGVDGSGDNPGGLNEILGKLGWVREFLEKKNEYGGFNSNPGDLNDELFLKISDLLRSIDPLHPLLPRGLGDLNHISISHQHLMLLTLQRSLLVNVSACQICKSFAILSKFESKRLRQQEEIINLNKRLPARKTHHKQNSSEGLFSGEDYFSNELESIPIGSKPLPFHHWDLIVLEYEIPPLGAQNDPSSQAPTQTSPRQPHNKSIDPFYLFDESFKKLQQTSQNLKKQLLLPIPSSFLHINERSQSYPTYSKYINRIKTHGLESEFAKQRSDAIKEQFSGEIVNFDHQFSLLRPLFSLFKHGEAPTLPKAETGEQNCVKVVHGDIPATIHNNQNAHGNANVEKNDKQALVNISRGGVHGLTDVSPHVQSKNGRINILLQSGTNQNASNLMNTIQNIRIRNTQQEKFEQAEKMRHIFNDFLRFCQFSSFTKSIATPHPSLPIPSRVSMNDIPLRRSRINLGNEQNFRAPHSHENDNSKIFQIGEFVLLPQFSSKCCCLSESCHSCAYSICMVVGTPFDRPSCFKHDQTGTNSKQGGLYSLLNISAFKLPVIIDNTSNTQAGHRSLQIEGEINSETDGNRKNNKSLLPMAPPQIPNVLLVQSQGNPRDNTNKAHNRSHLGPKSKNDHFSNHIFTISPHSAILNLPSSLLVKIPVGHETDKREQSSVLSRFQMLNFIFFFSAKMIEIRLFKQYIDCFDPILHLNHNPESISPQSTRTAPNLSSSTEKFFWLNFQTPLPQQTQTTLGFSHVNNFPHLGNFNTQLTSNNFNPQLQFPHPPLPRNNLPKIPRLQYKPYSAVHQACRSMENQHLLQYYNHSQNGQNDQNSQNSHTGTAISQTSTDIRPSSLCQDHMKDLQNSKTSQLFLNLYEMEALNLVDSTGVVDYTEPKPQLIPSQNHVLFDQNGQIENNDHFPQDKSNQIYEILSDSLHSKPPWLRYSLAETMSKIYEGSVEEDTNGCQNYPTFSQLNSVHSQNSNSRIDVGMNKCKNLRSYLLKALLLLTGVSHLPNTSNFQTLHQKPHVQSESSQFENTDNTNDNNSQTFNSYSQNNQFAFQDNDIHLSDDENYTDNNIDNNHSESTLHGNHNLFLFTPSLPIQKFIKFVQNLIFFTHFVHKSEISLQQYYRSEDGDHFSSQNVGRSDCLNRCGKNGFTCCLCCCTLFGSALINITEQFQRDLIPLLNQRKKGQFTHPFNPRTTASEFVIDSKSGCFCSEYEPFCTPVRELPLHIIKSKEREGLHGGKGKNNQQSISNLSSNQEVDFNTRRNTILGGVELVNRSWLISHRKDLDLVLIEFFLEHVIGYILK